MNKAVETHVGRKISMRAREQMDALEKMIAIYERTGVGIYQQTQEDIERDWRQADRLYDYNPVIGTVRAMAREMKRPFVFANVWTPLWKNQTSNWGYVSSWNCHLQFPNSKRLDVLAAPFLLANLNDTVHGTTTPFYKRRYAFHLKEEHKPLFDAFLHKCEHDLEYRKALRLD